MAFCVLIYAGGEEGLSYEWDGDGRRMGVARTFWTPKR